MNKIVIALGGNALGKTNTEQKEKVKLTAKVIVDLFEKGNSVLVVHGNGPQVGMIQSSFDIAHKSGEIKEGIPFPECGSMSQGYIGYHIQNAINNELNKRNLKQSVATIVTQTIVDKDSKAFLDPTKPIGNFMSEDEAKKIASEKGWIVKEDAGRGWRRVIASPEPIDIVEKDVITSLLDNNVIVIAGGGGGIPVYRDGNNLIGVDAVIDKDFTASKIAQLINAEKFIILTAEDKVIINYGKENAIPLDQIDIEELQDYVDKGEFPAGSMKPKVQAAISFVKSTSKNAYIADLQLGSKVLTGESGTKIYKK